MSGSCVRWSQTRRDLAAGIAMMLALSGCRATSRSTIVPRIQHGLAGVVYDSLTFHALQDATVQIVDAEHPASHPFSPRTNERGEYAVENLPPGRYMATFYHHALDTLGLQANARLVDVTAQGTWLPMSIPSAEHLRTIECGARAVVDSNGVLIGRVVDATSRNGAAHAEVTASWSEVAIARGGVSVQPKTARTQTADGGWFNLCGVPLNVEVSVQASRDSDRTGAIAVRVPATGVATHDLFVGGTAVVALRGNVIGNNGGPIPHAHVTLDGRTEVAADDNGIFTLVATRVGTQLLATRAIGFFPDERAVNVIPDSVQWVEVTLPTVMSVLDTVHINGKRIRDMDAHGFESRRQAGIGSFFSQGDLQAMAPRSVTEILDHSPRTPTIRMGNGKLGLRIRGTPCLPTLYLNGMGMPVLEDVDELNHLVDVAEIREMEIYTPGEAPREFERRNQCAVLVVWTTR